MRIYISDVQKEDPERIMGKSHGVGLVTTRQHAPRMAPFVYSHISTDFLANAELN